MTDQHDPVQHTDAAGVERHEVASVSRRSFVRTAAAATAAGVVAAGGVGWLATRSFGDDGSAAQAPIGDLRAGNVRGTLPSHPSDTQWLARRPVAVPLFQQNITTPMLGEQTIREVRLRVLHNGQEIGFHLEWQDDDVDDLDAMGQFRDSVAVQLPVGDGAATPITMGGVGQPVHILHWKASWERQVEHGQRQLRDAFPNAVNEVTPEDMMGEEAARVFYPALYVGNLAASRDRESSVEELVAEGFGTLTTQEEQRARGRSIFQDGRWQVVIFVPMTGDATLATVTPGRATRVALAAWDGGRGNRGARKHWSNWVPIEVDG